MLPSVSAGSAALTKYAQASVTASEHPSRDPEMPADSDRKTARHHGERAQAIPAEVTVVRETRAAIAALLDMLHSRVQTAALDLGLPAETAEEAASQAVAQVAEAIARDGAQAARIVQAVLDRIDTGNPVNGDDLLHLAARGLTLVIDRSDGVVDIRPPAIDIVPHGAARENAGAGPSMHHLLDITDTDAGTAAPILAALNAAHGAVTDAAQGLFKPTHGATAAGHVATLIAPTIYAPSISALLAPHMGGQPNNPTTPITQIATAISTALVSAATSTTGISVADVAAVVSALKSSSAVVDADAGSGVFKLISKATPVSLEIAVQPKNGLVTVTVGERVVAISPAAFASTGTVPAQPAEEDTTRRAASLPVRDISPNIPTGSVLDRPAGTPFIPPEIEHMPPPTTTPRNTPQSPSAQKPTAVAHQLEAFPAQPIDSVRNTTVLRGIEVASRSESPAGLARISLDISADVGPAPTSATLSEKLGRLGRSVPAPAQSETGPVMQQGYADGSATHAPVLPAWHAGTAVPLPPAPPARKKLPPRAYRSEEREDAFTRSTPANYEGLVFSSVVFSV